jgi:hypothetical protein
LILPPRRPTRIGAAFDFPARLTGANVKSRLLASAAVAPFVLALGGGASAQQAPAVAYPNFTIGGEGGAALGQGYGQVEGTFAFPLGSDFGAQFDGSAGSESGEFTGQAAAQLFWRNPASALVGVYGAYGRLDDGFAPNAARLAPEAEFYFSRFTLSGIAGVNFDDNDRFFAQARASFYVDDNTKIFAGYVRDDTGAQAAGVDAAAVGFEHLFPSTGVSIFGEARVGDHDYRAAWAGIKFYLGGPTGSGKSLIGRDREDVAPVWRFLEQKKQKVASSTSATTTTVTTTTTTTTTTRTSSTTTTQTTASS